MGKVTQIFDYFVIVTGTNKRQINALSIEVSRAMKQDGEQHHGLEGSDNSGWIIEDFGDVVVHIFTPEMRKTYDLERLWADAPKVDWKSALTATR